MHSQQYMHLTGIVAFGGGCAQLSCAEAARRAAVGGVRFSAKQSRSAKTLQACREFGGLHSKASMARSGTLADDTKPRLRARVRLRRLALMRGRGLCAGAARSTANHCAVFAPRVDDPVRVCLRMGTQERRPPKYSRFAQCKMYKICAEKLYFV